MIPKCFSWDDLNRSAASHRQPGQHFPRLEYSKGSPRDAKSAHLTGAEAMTYTLASIEIIEPLLKPEHKNLPCWIAWKAYVAICHFLQRKSFVRSVDPAKLRELNQDFLVKFHAVKEWQGYEKPKMHPSYHLGEALEEFGPFIGFWCMPWESFVQVLKSIFEMTNYIGAPLFVAMFWSQKFVLHLRDKSRAKWHEDIFETVTEFLSPAECPPSALLNALCESGAPPTSIRYVQKLSRGEWEVGIQTWVLIAHADGPRIGFVSEMAETRAHDPVRNRSMSRIHIIAIGCRPAVYMDGLMQVDSHVTATGMLVSLELTPVSTCVCVSPADAERLKFRVV